MENSKAWVSSKTQGGGCLPQLTESRFLALTEGRVVSDRRPCVLPFSETRGGFLS